MDISTTAIDGPLLKPATSAEAPGRRLRRIVESTCDGLYRFILLRVNADRDAADELLQQTCHEAVRHRRIPEDDEQCEAWLRGIARNLIRRHWRVRRQARKTVPADEAWTAGKLAEEMDARPLPADVLARREVVQAILLAVSTLTAAEQQLVSDFYFQGRSQAEIAERIGVTVKSVETRLYRVRGRLRAALRQHEKE